LSCFSNNKRLDQVRKSAIEQGVSKSTIDQAFSGLTAPDPSIISKDSAQAEFSQNFWRYFNKRVSKTRINNGNDTLKQNACAGLCDCSFFRARE